MPDEPKTTCDGIEIDLVGYLYKELDAERRQQIAGHLADCPTCSGRLAVLTESVVALRDATPGLKVAGGFQPIAEQIDDVLQAKRRRKAIRLWTARVAIAGVAAMVLFSLFFPPQMIGPDGDDAVAKDGPFHKGVEVTVYNEDLGVIKTDRQTFDLKKGVNEIRFQGVASGIDPTSVHFWSLTDFAGTRVLDQNYEYDLASSGKILEKYLNEQITVVGKDRETLTGILKSYDTGQLILAIPGSEKVKMLPRTEIRSLQFARLPEGLTAKPTLVWTVRAEKPGEHDTRIAYMTRGMRWEADYIVTLRDDNRVDLAAWVSLDNQSGGTYKDAKLKLMAGDIHRVREKFRSNVSFGVSLGRSRNLAAFQEKSFFEYHLYTLPRKTIIKDKQKKQIELFAPVAGVKSKRHYEYHAKDRYGQDVNGVRVILTIRNAKNNKMGMPLPAGRVRVMARDADGEEHLVGEDRIDHLPRGEEMKIWVGNASGLIGTRKALHTRHDGQEQDIEIKLRNHTDEDVTIQVIEKTHRDWKAWTITKSSHPYTKTDAKTFKFQVPVGRGKETTITYTIQDR